MQHDGKDCQFSHAEKHRPAAPAVVEPEAKPKAKPKGKAKGKAKAAVPCRMLTPAMIHRHDAGQGSDAGSEFSVPGLVASSPDTTPRERPSIVQDYLEEYVDDYRPIIGFQIVYVDDYRPITNSLWRTNPRSAWNYWQINRTCNDEDD